jgi:adenylate cyclase
MGKEIERKFLLAGEIPTELLETSVIFRIEQTYLLTGDEELRVRKIVDPYGYSTYFQTIKSGSGMERNEVEIEISKRVYDFLLKGRSLKPLIKNRRYVYVDELEISIDSYADDFPTTIEVEYKTKDEAITFQPLSWFGRELTNTKEYRNQDLWKAIQ